MFKKLLTRTLLITTSFISLALPNIIFADIKWLPVIASSPETGLQYGALVLQNLDDEADQGRLSSIQYIAISSTENQQRLVVKPTLYALDYKLKMSPILDYSSFPEKFFGLGNDTDEDNEEDFSSDSLFAKFNAEYNFYSNFHLQFNTSIDDRKINELENGGIIDSILTSSQADEYQLKSLGFGLIWDTRDSPRYPSKGIFALLSQERFKGDGFDYDENIFELKGFYPLAEKQVLAAQYIQMTQDADSINDIPFINLSTIGGRNVVRGIFEGRYRAPDMQALQVEYRKHGYRLFNIDLGFTVFAGTGQVSGDSQINENEDQFHSAAGLGGHFFFNPEDKTTIRFDVAVSEDGPGVYLMIDQAF